jgi:hypothetical protein
MCPRLRNESFSRPQENHTQLENNLTAVHWWSFLFAEWTSDRRRDLKQDTHALLKSAGPVPSLQEELQL